MYFPAISGERLKYIVVVVLIVVAGFLIWMFLPSGSPSITASFNPTGALKAGDTTTLHVVVSNTLGKDVGTLTVTVNVDPSSLTVTGSPDVRTTFRKTERREFDFPITITTTYAGTYSVEVVADMDGTAFTHTLMLEVKGS